MVEHIGRTGFYVMGLQDRFRDEDKTFDLPDLFLAQVLGISYTHARALLNVEISPTVYRDKYFLPVIDPMKLIPNQ